MRVLLIHNKYKEAGGEDKVFEAESFLLSKFKNKVTKIEFNNEIIFNNFFNKIFIGGMSVFNYFSYKRVKEQIKSFNPDIIHIHNIFFIASPSILFVAKKYRIPVIMTLHNYRFLCPNGLMFRKGKICEKCKNNFFPFYGILYGCYRNSRIQTFLVAYIITFHKIINTWNHKIDKYIALTSFSKTQFKNSKYIPFSNIVVKPNFIEDVGEGLEKRRNFFLYIGRLSEEKGINDLLNATKFYNFRIKIIGDGKLKTKILKYAEKNKKIEYLGYRNKSFIIKQLKQSKALIFPSLWYEGFPMVIVESFATGTPVITSNIGSQAEIVKNNYNGLHFQVGNAESLAKVLKKFDNLKDKTKFYKNARNTYLKKYTPEINYKLLMNIYNQTIKDAKKNKNY